MQMMVMGMMFAQKTCIDDNTSDPNFPTKETIYPTDVNNKCLGFSTTSSI